LVIVVSLVNSFPTFLGMPRFDLPPAAAYMARS
jgi:hypothetical protein